MEVIPAIYRNRDYQAHRLSEAAFAGLNVGLGNALGLSVTGCLDAPDSLPTGCMTGFTGRDGARHVTMDTIDRGISQEERERREAISKRIIAELLAEDEARTRTKRSSQAVWHSG